MALILKVGVSRKVSADYQSRGYTLDVQSEFDPRTLDDTNTLAQAADHLFQLANVLLDEQVQKATGDALARPAPANGNRPSYGQPRNGNGSRPTSGNNGYRDGNGNGNGRTDNPRTITEAQARAVTNMAKRLRVNPDTIAGRHYEKPLRELNIREASELIDSMKADIEGQQAKAGAR